MCCNTSDGGHPVQRKSCFSPPLLTQALRVQLALPRLSDLRQPINCLTCWPYTYLVHHTEAWFCIQTLSCVCLQEFFFLAFVSVAISSSWLLAIKKVYVFKSHYDSKTAVGYMYVKHTASSRSGLQTADCFLPALYTFVSLASVSPLGNQDESSHNSRGRFNTPPSHHY